MILNSQSTQICYWLQRDRNWDCEVEEEKKDFEQKSLLILKWQKYKGVIWNIAQYLLSVFEVITGLTSMCPIVAICSYASKHTQKRSFKLSFNRLIISYFNCTDAYKMDKFRLALPKREYNDTQRFKSVLNIRKEITFCNFNGIKSSEHKGNLTERDPNKCLHQAWSISLNINN